MSLVLQTNCYQEGCSTGVAGTALEEGGDASEAGEDQDLSLDRDEIFTINWAFREMSLI